MQCWCCSLNPQSISLKASQIHWTMSVSGHSRLVIFKCHHTRSFWRAITEAYKSNPVSFTEVSVWQLAMIKDQNDCCVIRNPQSWILLRGLERTERGSQPGDLHLLSQEGWEQSVGSTEQHCNPDWEQHQEDSCRELSSTVILAGSSTRRVPAGILCCAAQPWVHLHNAALSSKESKGTHSSSALPCRQCRNSWPQRSTSGRPHGSKSWFRSYLMSWYTEERLQSFCRVPPPMAKWGWVAAFAWCLWLFKIKKKKKKFSLKQCPNLVHQTQGWMSAVTQEEENTQSILDK